MDKKTGLFAALLLLSSYFAAAAQPMDLVLNGVSPAGPQRVTASISLYNPSSDPSGTLTVQFSDNLQLDTSSMDWKCQYGQLSAPGNTCTTGVAVNGQQDYMLHFAFRRLFASDLVYLSYNVPSLNTTIETKFFLSNSPSGQSLSASGTFYSSLGMLFLGLLLWVLAFESGRLKRMHGASLKILHKVDENALATAVLANLFVAVGITFAFSPDLPAAAVLFSMVFAGGVVFLLHLRQSLRK